MTAGASSGAVGDLVSLSGNNMKFDSNIHIDRYSVR